MYTVHYLNARNQSHHVDVTQLAAALNTALSITECTRIPAHVTRNGSVIYDAANPQPVIVRHV